MNFKEFIIESKLKEEDHQSNTIDDLHKKIESTINELVKKDNLYTDGYTYFVDYKNKTDVLTGKDIIGYIIYKNDESDDFHVGQFIYRIKTEKIDIVTDDKLTFTTIADIDIHIKNKLKGHILK